MSSEAEQRLAKIKREFVDLLAGFAGREDAEAIAGNFGNDVLIQTLEELSTVEPKRAVKNANPNIQRSTLRSP